MKDPKSIGKLIGPKQSYVTSHYYPDVMDFDSAPPARDQQWTVICEWHGRNPLTHSVWTLQPSGVFFTDGESWALHQGPQWPCSELSRSCLNGILIFSCFCVVVFFFGFPSGVRPLCTYADASVDILPQTFSSEVIFGTSGGQRDVSGRVERSFRPFQFKTSSSRMYAKNRKTFICLFAEPHTGLIDVRQVNTSLC